MKPNDLIAKYYDIIYSEIKGGNVLEQEIALVTTLAPEKSAILDIGCGTGRHAIPLAKLGYSVTAVEPSTEMLTQLEQKISTPANQQLKSKLKIINVHFPTGNLRNKSFNLIILMWNALHEVAKNQDELTKTLSACKELLKQNGKILINIDDIQTFDVQNTNTSFTTTHQNKKYIVEWNITNFNPKNNIANLNEKISVYNKNGDLIESAKTELKQKWWTQQEIEDACKKLNLVLDVCKIKANDELYLVLTS